jgi:hypothetical protein
VTATHSGRKKDENVEFRFCHETEDGRKEWITCLSRKLSEADIKRGIRSYHNDILMLTADTRVIYRNGSEEYQTVLGGPPPSRGTSESDDEDADDEGVRTAGHAG